MNTELVAVLVTTSFQSILILIGLVMLPCMTNNQTSEHAALHLQGRQVEEVLREKPESRRGRKCRATQWRPAWEQNA